MAKHAKRTEKRSGSSDWWWLGLRAAIAFGDWLLNRAGSAGPLSG
jgi:hypothetical protein